MGYSITDIIFLFFIYSFIGWLWETIYCSIHDKKFAYRGFSSWTLLSSLWLCGDDGFNWHKTISR